MSTVHTTDLALPCCLSLLQDVLSIERDGNKLVLQVAARAQAGFKGNRRGSLVLQDDNDDRSLSGGELELKLKATSERSAEQWATCVAAQIAAQCQCIASPDKGEQQESEGELTHTETEEESVDGS